MTIMFQWGNDAIQKVNGRGCNVGVGVPGGRGGGREGGGCAWGKGGGEGGTGCGSC